MPVLADIPMCKFEDGVFIIPLQPPTAIGGWSLQFKVMKRLGPDCSGLIVKTAASGYGGGQSGITVLDSGQGRFRVAYNAGDTSGMDPGNFAFLVERLDSGSRTVLTKGTITLLPGGTA